VDISQIRKLIRLIQSSNVTEIEVTEGDQTVRIRRGGSAEVLSAAPQPMGAAGAPAATGSVTAAVGVTGVEGEEHVVKSPMVGTFYRAPSPESDPFVTEGTKIKKGDILCIIEAMKLMNEIEAEYDGVVEKILVENASPVEYGQPIFVITPLT